MIAALLLIIFSACMVYAIIHSLRYTAVPNIIHAVLVGAFFLLCPLIGVDASFYFNSITAFVVFSIFCFVAYFFGGMGAGAAKLISATGLYMGMTGSAVSFVLFFTLFGGMLSLIKLLVSKDKNSSVNYSLGVGIAGLVTYPGTYLGKMGVDALSALIGIG